MGIKIDKKQNFDSHIASTCLKDNQKLGVLGRLAKLLSFNVKLLLFETFFEVIIILWYGCSVLENEITG